MRKLNKGVAARARDFLRDWSLPRQLAGQKTYSDASRSHASDVLRPRLEEADRVGTSVCPFCAVGCGQLVYAKNGKPIHIEGDPRSPVNQGTLCPKGAGTLGVLLSPQRHTYRAVSRPLGRPSGRSSRSTGHGAHRAADQADAGRDLRRRAAGRPRGEPHARGSPRSAAPRWTTRKTTSSRSCSAVGWASSTSRTKPGSDTPPRCLV